LWSRQSRAEDAHDLLSTVYAEFSEGFETPDILVAAWLLVSLTQPRKAEEISRFRLATSSHFVDG
jgi:hypothetical protein